MATITQVAKRLDISSRWVSQLIAEGVLPRRPKGEHDLDECFDLYDKHGTERYIELSANPVRERAEIVERLRKQGRHDKADYHEEMGRKAA